MLPTASNAHIVEVSAGASPSAVVNAIVNSATAKESRPSNPNRGIMLGFLFIFVFAAIVYFREEIYTVTKDISKHPILSSVESRQVQQYLGSRWSFGSGSDVASSREATPAEIAAATAEVASQILESTGNVTGNSTGS